MYNKALDKLWNEVLEMSNNERLCVLVNLISYMDATCEKEKLDISVFLDGLENAIEIEKSYRKYEKRKAKLEEKIKAQLG